MLGLHGKLTFEQYYLGEEIGHVYKGPQNETVCDTC